MRIITNNVPRDTILGYELTPKEREEFDYLDFSTTEAQARDFVRYRGQLIDLGDFMAVQYPRENKEFGQWDGYVADTFFSGILVKYLFEEEQVIMGRYYT